MAYASGQSFPAKKVDPTFVAKCTCPDPKCNVEQIASRTSRFFGGSNNVAIVALSQLKEVSTIAPIPGLRQAAGGALIILETIGLMGDNAAAFDQIASQTIDNCMLLLVCKELIDEASEGVETDRAKQLLDETGAEFTQAMNHITQSMVKLNERGRIKRFFQAKADRNELDKHRSAIAHLVNKLQIVMQAATIARTGNIGKQMKALTQDDIHKSTEKYEKLLVDRKEAEFQKKVEYHNSPQWTTNATVNFQAGDNSKVYRSGNIITEVISGQNDYSNNTNNITISNGDFRLDGSRRSRNRRRSSGSSDSDEHYTPQHRRAERERYEGRW